MGSTISAIACAIIFGYIVYGFAVYEVKIQVEEIFGIWKYHGGIILFSIIMGSMLYIGLTKIVMKEHCDMIELISNLSSFQKKLKELPRKYFEFEEGGKIHSCKWT